MRSGFVIIGVVSTHYEWKEVKSDSEFGNERGGWVHTRRTCPKCLAMQSMKGLQAKEGTMMKTRKYWGSLILITAVFAVILFGLFLIMPAGVWAQDNGSAEVIEPEFSSCPGTEFWINFGSPGNVFMFYLTPTGKGTARVSVADQYLFGPDIWRVELHQVGKAGKSAVGNGAVGDYAGTLKMKVKVGGAVPVHDQRRLCASWI